MPTYLFWLALLCLGLKIDFKQIEDSIQSIVDRFGLDRDRHDLLDQDEDVKIVKYTHGTFSSSRNGKCKGLTIT